MWGFGVTGEWVQRLVATPRTPAIGAGIAGLLAVIESVVRGLGPAPSAGASGQAQFVLAFGLLGLAGTLPLSLLRSSPPGGALAVSLANVLSLCLFQTLSVAALIAQIIVLYVLGRTGAPFLAAAMSAPFFILALVAAAGADGGRETKIFTLLSASCGAMAAWGGSVQRARNESRAQIAAEQAFAGTVVENVTRGERARISANSMMSSLITSR